ncbi:DUF397 domain-containing protein [Streptomyces sp. NPDC057137]|uniref:DUF397 domain-containing protein n=1 Tax=Streptomyces sp. NPDC057137 TaxID=3346030 RepID=UPI00362CE3FC
MSPGPCRSYRNRGSSNSSPAASTSSPAAPCPTTRPPPCWNDTHERGLITINTHTETGRPYGEWFKSSYSSEQGTDCVEACPQTGVVHIRDSKRNADNGPRLIFPLTAVVLEQNWGRLGTMNASATRSGRRAHRAQYSTASTCRRSTGVAELFHWVHASVLNRNPRFEAGTALPALSGGLRRLLLSGGAAHARQVAYYGVEAAAVLGQLSEEAFPQEIGQGGPAGFGKVGRDLSEKPRGAVCGEEQAGQPCGGGTVS